MSTTKFQGSHASWDVLKFSVKFPGPGESVKMILDIFWSWKFKLKVLDSPGIGCDADTMMQMQKYSRLHA